MNLRISLPPRFHFDTVVRSHGWYDLPPFAYDAVRGELTTFLAGAARVRFRARQGGLEVSAEAADRETLRRLARRIFSLDVDLSSLGPAFEGEPALRRALERGGGRMLRAPTLFEDAVKILLTTNCSWQATRGMVERLIVETGEGGSFPEPEQVARLSPARLARKIRCGYRAEALSRFARRVASCRLDLSLWERVEIPAAGVRESILSEYGFGPYAAEGLLRILGRHEYFALDSWSRQKYRRLYPGPVRTTDGSIARRYSRFGGQRGLALWLDLTRDWHEAAEKPPALTDLTPALRS